MTSRASRRRAREMGVDLARVTGTGPHGRITVNALEEAAGENGGAGVAAALPHPAPQTRGGSGRPPRSPVVAHGPGHGAERQGDSQFSATRSVDVARIIEIACATRGMRQGSEPLVLSITDFLIHAVARCLLDFPLLNSSYHDGPAGEPAVRLHPPVHFGLATDTPAGLLVPVLKGADTLSLAQVSRYSTRAGA